MARTINGKELDLDRLREAIAAESKRWGENVRKRRKALNLTQGQLAILIGPTFPVQTISKVERGQIVPRDYLRSALAVRLAVEVDELFPFPKRAELTKAAM